MGTMSLRSDSILITGGTGSFGQAFVKRLLKDPQCPGRIVILSRGEYNQWEMQRRINDPRLRFLIGDVRDRERLKYAFDGVDTVVHAAALKHVDAMEYNPTEAVETNVNGAMAVVQACIDCGVTRCLALSTDKAVSPANLYGATKVCMERVFVAANNYSKTMFSCTRYGNVWGSRGSFIENLRCSEFATITDPSMTRFLMTLEHATNFVVQALCEMSGGEIFVPTLRSVRLSDILTVIAAGKAIIPVGIRPGEKMHESMVSIEEARRTSVGEWCMKIHPDILLPEGRCERFYSPDGKDYSSDGPSLLPPEEAQIMIQAMDHNQD